VIRHDLWLAVNPSGSSIGINHLDEYIPNIQQEIPESLQEIASASPTTRLFLSGRTHIRGGFGRYHTNAIMEATTPTIGDIMRYPEMILDRDTRLGAMGNGL